MSKETTPVVEAPVVEATILEGLETNVASNLTVASLLGKEYDVIVKGLKSMSGWSSKNQLKITNVGFNRDQLDENGDPKGVSMSITVASKLDQYLESDDVNAVNGYVKSQVSTIFTSAMQLAAILRQNGEAGIAAAIIKKPKVTVLALQGARISVFAHEYAGGEVEQSPFSSKENDYVFEHDTIRYYPYDITLGIGGERANQVLFNTAFSM